MVESAVVLALENVRQRKRNAVIVVAQYLFEKKKNLL
jgi:hypothetical protein